MSLLDDVTHAKGGEEDSEDCTSNIFVKIAHYQELVAECQPDLHLFSEVKKQAFSWVHLAKFVS